MAENEESSPLQYIHSWHFDMLINQERNEFYRDLIKDNCRDKVVLEIGTGGGLLAVLMMKYGAKKVICCEENPLLASAAKQLFKRLGLEEHIHLIPKNSKQIQSDEIPQVDIILHELFGSDPFGEEMVPTLSDARRFLKPGGIFLPEKIQIIYQPIRTHHLPVKIIFEDIELIEMSHLLSEIHPSLRKRDPLAFPEEIYSLPVVSVDELLEKPYSYTEKNVQLIGVDAIEVSFFIIHKDKKLQAAKFEAYDGQKHWRTMTFYKLDIRSDQVLFASKDNIQMTVL